MRTKITRRDWRILHGCLTVAKLYCSVLAMFLLLRFFPPMPLQIFAAVIVAMIYLFEWALRPLGRAIRNSYEIVGQENSVVPDPSLRCNQSVIVKQEERFDPVEGTPA